MNSADYLAQINQFEDHYNYDTTYMRELLESSLQGYRKFEQSMALVSHLELLNLDEHWAAKLTATKTLDCGDCLQLGVKMAIENGVDRQLIASLLYDNTKLPEQLKEICGFTAGITTNNLSDTLLAKMQSRYSKGQLLEFGIIISGAMMFPTIKRTLGYTKQCSLNKIDI